MGRFPSRGLSSSYPDNSPPSDRHPAASTSVADLSQYLDQHTLSDGPQSDARFSRTRVLYPPSDLNHSSHRLASSRRQKVIRRQCSSAQLARVASIVEDVVQDEQNTYEASSTSSFSDSTTSPSLSPDEALAARSSYFQLAYQPSPAALAEISPQGSAQHSIGPEAYKISKDLRYSVSKDSIGGHQKVQKSIRMRKKSRDISMMTEKVARR